MPVHLTSDDLLAAVTRLKPVLDRTFLRGWFSVRDLERLQRVIGGELDDTNLLVLLVQSAGAQLLAERRRRIGRGAKTSVRHELLKTLDDDTLEQLWDGLNRGPIPANRARAVDQLADFKWHRGKSSALRLTRALGLPEAFAGVREGRREKTYEVAAQTTPRPLKSYQRGILQELRRQYEQRDRVMVSAFTGTGKTRMGMEYAIELLLQHGRGCVFWIAQKGELLDQACESIEELWPSRAANAGDALLIYRYMEGTQFTGEVVPRDRPTFVVATAQQTIARLGSGDEFLEGALAATELLVVDEAHHTLARGHKAIVDAYAGARAAGGERQRVLGLTATPGRSNLTAPDESRQLADLFGGCLVVPQTPPDEVALDWFQSEGYLARVEHRRQEIDSQVSQTLGKKQLEWTSATTGQTEFTNEFLKIVGADSMRNRGILEQIQRLAHEGRHLLVFTCSIDQAELLFRALLAQGIDAGIVHSKIDARDRRHTIRRFRAGEIHVLINVEVLTTGFDAPRIDTLIMCRPTLSRVLYEQMLGRGLRGPKMGGTAHCLVIDFTDNFEHFDQPQAWEAFWEDWQEEPQKTDEVGAPASSTDAAAWQLVEAAPIEEGTDDPAPERVN